LIEDWSLFPFDLINPKSYFYSVIVQPNLIYPSERLESANLIVSCAPTWDYDSQVDSYQEKTVKPGPLLNISKEEESLDREKSREDLGANPEAFIITVLAGGGTYGLELYDLVVRCIPELKSIFRNLLIYFIVGPHASYCSLEQYKRLGICVRRCVPSTFSYFRASDVVISQGGFQTLMEILKSEASAVFFPRRREQRLNLNRFPFPWFRTLDALNPKKLSELIREVSAVKARIHLEIANGASIAARSIRQLYLKSK